MLTLQCQSCGHAGAPGVGQGPEGPALTCGACGAVHDLAGRLQAPLLSIALEPVAPDPPALLEPPPAVPRVEAAPGPSGQGGVVAVPRTMPDGRVRCPKCGHRGLDPAACPSCGLVFALIPPGIPPWEEVAPPLRAAAQQARSLWALVETDPGDEAAHEAVVGFCRSRGLMLWLAGFYRLLASDWPGHPVVDRWRETVGREVMAQSSALQGTVRDEVAQVARTIRWTLIVVSVVLLVTVLVLAFQLARPADPIFP